MSKKYTTVNVSYKDTLDDESEIIVDVDIVVGYDGNIEVDEGVLKQAAERAVDLIFDEALHDL